LPISSAKKNGNEGDTMNNKYNVQDFFNIESSREDYDMEFKAAKGKDGKGELPKSLWETYSAMANTDGGMILLGIEEKKEKLKYVHLENTDKIIKDLWNGLNNPQKVSVNLLQNEDVFTLKSPKGENLLAINVPRALRTQRPVYKKNNPLTGSYRRNNDGDYKCSEQVVKQMLGDQANDTRDANILEGYNYNDIDYETLKIYRQNFANLKPSHPFNDYDDYEFLRQIGAFASNRQSKVEGLTVAGLLMFGKLRSILDAVPNYIVDYQERPRSIAENRWIDRIHTDFSWSGNLYDFYRLVINKLYQELKVPFALIGDKRMDDTLVHEALREALVNTLIHADYNGNCSILVVKRPDLFGFRNPGTLRIPKEDILRGGLSDCRNRTLQKMFQLVNLGEQAGSGFPKIMKNWEQYKWRLPELDERIESNQTLLTLKTISLLPEDVVDELQNYFGRKFDELSNISKLALVTTKVDGCITHKRMMEITKEHPHDLSIALHSLVDKKLLCSEGAGRATFYFIPGFHPMADFDSTEFQSNITNSVHYDENSVHYDENSVHSERSLQALAALIKSKGRAPADFVQNIIIKMCAKKELSIRELAALLGRSEQTIRNNYVNRMCDKGLLLRKYPSVHHHPRQKYYSEKL
jgi:ATP-dependent DNA helicase RecG